MNISRITVGRLFNLGNYEHVRYELTVDLSAGENATMAITAVESIMEGMKPLKTMCLSSEAEIAHKAREIESMKAMTATEFQRQYGHCEGTPSEIIERAEQALSEKITKREAAKRVAETARKLFNDLGGASQWKDAKLDWQDDHDLEG